MSSGTDHADVQSLLGAYALDAVDPDERELVEHHLATCPRCRAEVADHREVAAQLAGGGAPAPDGLWDRIAASLEEPPPPSRLTLVPPTEAPPRPATVAPAPGRDRWRTARRSLAAVAAAVILVLGVVVVRQEQRLNDAEEQLAGGTLETAANRALADPEALQVTLAPTDDAPATSPVVAVLRPDGRGYLVANNLPALRDDRTYQLWGVGPNGVVSLAVLGADPTVVPFLAEGEIEALVVTDERRGGVPTAEGPAVVTGEVA